MTFFNSSHKSGCIWNKGQANLIALALLCVSASSYSAYQEASGSAYECTQVALEDIDPSLLTKEERIALLNNNLNESINNFSTCVGAAQQSMTGGGYGEGDGNTGDNGTGADGSNTASTSTAGQSTGSTGNKGEGVTTPQNTTQEIIQPPSNSSTPAARGVIPPKDNDKIICKLLFREIQSVTDPAMIEGLKEQYTNYKCG